MAESPSSTLDQLLSDLNWVRGLARKLVADPLRADDAVQEASLIAMRRAQTGETLSRGWLATVVRNLLRRGHRIEEDREVRESKGARAEALPSADELNSRMELQRLLAEAVSDLPEPYRSTLILRFLEEASVEEIAGAHGVVAATVRSRVSRGLALLRERLDRQSGGRENWLPGVAMLAGPSRVRDCVAASGATVGVLGGILMSKLPLSVFALVLAALCWQGWGHYDSVDPLEVTSGSLESLTGSSVAQELPTPSPARTEAAVDSDSGAMEATRDLAAAQGWWLSGLVLTGGKPASGPVDIEVRASFVGGLDRELSQRSRDSGDIEVDVSELFSSEGQLVRELLVTCSSPGFMPASTSITPSAEDRQGPFIGADATRLSFQLDLPPVSSTVQGQLVPVGWDGALDLEVALLRVMPSGHELVSRCTADTNGQYVLSTPFEGDHWIVAWCPSPWDEPVMQPRPGNLPLEVGQPGRVAVHGPELIRGESVSGSVKYLGEHPVPGATVNLRLSTPDTYGVVSGATSRAGVSRGFHVVDLVWTESGYELLHVRGKTDSNGQFSASGLVRAPYWWAVTPFSKEEVDRPGDHADPAEVGDWIEKQNASQTDSRYLVPSEHDLNLVTTSYSIPLEIVADAPVDAMCVIQEVDDEGRKWGSRSFGRSSANEPFRHVLAVSPSSPSAVLVSCPGSQSQMVDLPGPTEVGDSTLRVVLASAADRTSNGGSIEIRLKNDAERLAEWAELRLLPLPRTSRAWQRKYTAVRRGDGFVFTDIAAGRYRATLRVVNVEEQLLDAGFARETFDLEVAAHEGTVKELELQRGCRLVFEPGALPEGGIYMVKIEDSSGLTLPLQLVSPRSGRQLQGLDPALRAVSDALIPAGSYTVRAKGGQQEWRQAVQIDPGERMRVVGFD